MSSNNVHTAFIALGSNLGHRTEHLRSALHSLKQLGNLVRISSLYETEPVGNVVQPDFLNAVAELQTQLPPQELLSTLLQIEQKHGRDRSVSVEKGPRTLDLDLLSYDDVVMETAMLTLPHPAIAERNFVLTPLVEIAPEWRQPVSGKTAAELLIEWRQQHPGKSDSVKKFLERYSDIKKKSSL